MNKGVLDTDTLSEIMKGKHSGVSAKAAAYVREHERLTISSVSVAEVVFGLRRKGREEMLAGFEESLKEWDVLPFDDAAARTAGRINAALERQGLIIGLPDVMIAAIALCHGLAVVTGNVKHFEYVQSVGYELTIDNWRTE
ncbi:MAG TPA: PIN domain-containing protein [Polyangiaceae bacterium]|nr:PIN domain-containing protein [Polyangiaceae bacterium]